MYRIMLIDLYERPYSPEAIKSRAFIDRILALSGPDGGVVGGEDGVFLQRPLKDGGREAWDMIRRLRQKAWQKVGLNPQILWTEQDQIRVGAGDSTRETSSSSASFDTGPYSASGAPVTVPPSPRPSAGPRRHPTGLNRGFHNLAQSQNTPTSSVPVGSNPTTLQFWHQPLHEVFRPVSTTTYNPSTAATILPSVANVPASSALTSSPNVTPSLNHAASEISFTPSDVPAVQSQLPPFYSTISSPSPPLMDPMSPDATLMGAATPPSMADPNLNFDWDQWDAVFGQHLPVADELMELDPVAGLEFANLNIPVVSTRLEDGAGTAPRSVGDNAGLPTGLAR